MKGAGIIMPVLLQNRALKQLYLYHMAIEKKRLLACKPIYWVTMNANIEEKIQNWHTCFVFQATQPKNKTMSHKLLLRLWESVGGDMFIINKM